MGKSPIETPAAVAGEARAIGGAAYRRQVGTIIVGSDEYVVEADGALARVCYRCNGRGYMEEYAGIMNGVCFLCGGVGTGGKAFASVEAAQKATRTRMVAAARRERKAAEKVAAAKAAAAEWAAANPEVAEALERIAVAYEAAAPANEWEVDTRPFRTVDEFAFKARYGALTDKQTAYAAALVEEAAAEQVEADAKAAEQAAQVFLGEEGEKVTVTGEVKVAKYIEPTGYGRSGSRLVVVSTPAGEAKFFSSAEWVWDVEVGQTVEFTGTVKAQEVYQGQKVTQFVRPKGKVVA